MNMENNPHKKVVMILSGGMDSTTLLYKLLKEYDEVHALSFNYGQRHSKELDFAKAVTTKLSVPHTIINLSDVNSVMGGSSLTRKEIEVPDGHYAEESMKITVVPNRNMIMLSVAVAAAVSLNSNDVFFGAHAGDHDIYPDCRSEFIEALSKATEIANYVPVQIHAPFIKMSKGEIAALGKELGVPYEQTWTCYKGGDKPCGKCGACTERIEAMEFAGIKE